MKDLAGIIIFAIVAFVAWLQWYTDFQTAAWVLLGLGIFGGIIVVAIIILAAQRYANDAIIRHKEAESRIEVERWRVHRTELQSTNIVMRNAAIMARQQVRELMPGIKAQLEDKYRVQAEPEDAEFRPLEYGEEDL